MLPVTGRYTILVDPQGTDLGSMTLTLYDVPRRPDRLDDDRRPAASLTLGPRPGRTRHSASTAPPASASPSRLTNVTIGNTSCCGAQISILKPDGTNVVPPILVGTFGATMTATLPATARYTIGIDPQQAYTGGITLTLNPA